MALLACSDYQQEGVTENSVFKTPKSWETNNKPLENLQEVTKSKFREIVPHPPTSRTIVTKVRIPAGTRASNLQQSPTKLPTRPKAEWKL